MNDFLIGKKYGKKLITLTELNRLNEIYNGFENVLDVGCGNQVYRPFIKCENYQGVDVEISGHDNQKKIVDKFFDGIHLPYPDEEFDFIICTEVLEHALEPEQLLNEMKRVLKADGIMLITAPSMWGEHEVPYDFRRYTSYGIKKLVSDLGLNIVKIQKESPGISAYLQLGKSEIRASSNSKFTKAISLAWLGVTAIVLKKLLNLEMPRIYLTNLVIICK